MNTKVNSLDLPHFDQLSTVPPVGEFSFTVLRANASIPFIVAFRAVPSNRDTAWNKSVSETPMAEAMARKLLLFSITLNGELSV